METDRAIEYQENHRAWLATLKKGDRVKVRIRHTMHHATIYGVGIHFISVTYDEQPTYGDTDTAHLFWAASGLPLNEENLGTRLLQVS